MDTDTPQNEPLIPPHLEPVETPPEVGVQKKKIPYTFIIICIAVVIIVTFITLLTNDIKNKATITPTPTLKLTVKPTISQERILAPIASDSAFIALEASLASLSASLSEIEVTDPRLSLPTIELPLGFPK